MPLCTIGYEKRSLGDYLDLLKGHRVECVIDVRETAWSHKPGFSKAALAQALEGVGIRYVHTPFAGTPKWLRDSTDIQSEKLALYESYLEGHPEIVEAIDGVLREEGVARKRVAFTCFERAPEDCHRSILARAWLAYRGSGARVLDL